MPSNLPGRVANLLVRHAGGVAAAACEGASRLTQRLADKASVAAAKAAASESLSGSCRTLERLLSDKGVRRIEHWHEEATEEPAKSRRAEAARVFPGLAKMHAHMTTTLGLSKSIDAGVPVLDALAKATGLSIPVLERMNNGMEPPYCLFASAHEEYADLDLYYGQPEDLDGQAALFLSLTTSDRRFPLGGTTPQDFLDEDVDWLVGRTGRGLLETLSRGFEWRRELAVLSSLEPEAWPANNDSAGWERFFLLWETVASIGRPDLLLGLLADPGAAKVVLRACGGDFGGHACSMFCEGIAGWLLGCEGFGFERGFIKSHAVPFVSGLFGDISHLAEAALEWDGKRQEIHRFQRAISHPGPAEDDGFSRGDRTLALASNQAAFETYIRPKLAGPARSSFEGFCAGAEAAVRERVRRILFEMQEVWWARVSVPPEARAKALDGFVGLAMSEHRFSLSKGPAETGFGEWVGKEGADDFESVLRGIHARAAHFQYASELAAVLAARDAGVDFMGPSDSFSRARRLERQWAEAGGKGPGAGIGACDGGDGLMGACMRMVENLSAEGEGGPIDSDRFDSLAEAFRKDLSKLD